MKKKIICFWGFTLYLTLLNILFWSVGTLLVPEYNNCCHSGIDLDSVILIAIHSFILIFIFRIDRRYSILLMSILCMLLNLTFMNIGEILKDSHMFDGVMAEFMANINKVNDDQLKAVAIVVANGVNDTLASMLSNPPAEAVVDYNDILTLMDATSTEAQKSAVYYKLIAAVAADSGYQLTGTGGREDFLTIPDKAESHFRMGQRL